MNISQVSVPEVYKTSEDFRFFLKWFEDALTRIKYDTENLPDIYDPLRCPSQLLWMLADTMGFKYDDRLPVAFNRLVLVYFMSMIRNKGSKDGVTLAAETNLAQFNILEYGKEKDILYNRLEDTSIPVNAVSVTPHTPEGYIDVVYFSDRVPIDACIEYVRPLGMYLGQYAGVRYDARTKISIDARLCNQNEVGVSIGPTRVGHYSREDYARMQKISMEDDASEIVETTHDDLQSAYLRDSRNDYGYDPSLGTTRRKQYQKNRKDLDLKHKRELAWNSNSVAEGEPSVDAGYRALYSLQLCNNEHVIKSMIHGSTGDEDRMKSFFGLGYYPQDVGIHKEDEVNYPNPLPSEAYDEGINDPWNLRVDATTEYQDSKEVSSFFGMEPGKPSRDGEFIEDSSVPAVNPIMGILGDAMTSSPGLEFVNSEYIIADDKGNLKTVDAKNGVKNDDYRPPSSED